MIVARTGMERMPESCWQCRFRKHSRVPCMFKCVVMKLTHRIERDKRPIWCPLQDIDETLPAQLATARADVAAAEERCKKLNRLLEAQDE